MIKKAVVTGATGVIGTALVKKLSQMKAEVLVVARKSKNAEKLESISGVKVVYRDLSELESINEDSDYDVFFHLGWCGTKGKDRLDEDLQNKNITYTLDAVRLAKKLGCASFVGVGSQAEYGKVPYGVKLSPELKENPESAYGKAKLKARNAASELCKNLNINFFWCRVLSVYGINDNPNSLVMHTVNECLNSNECKLTKCEQQWDYIFSEDVAEGLILIGEKGKPNSTYVIGQGKSRLLKDYVFDIYKCIGNNKAKLNFGSVDYYPDQVMYLCADISRLKKDTGFIPKTDFKDGINRILEHKKREENNEEN